MTELHNKLNEVQKAIRNDAKSISDAEAIMQATTELNKAARDLYLDRMADRETGVVEQAKRAWEPLFRQIAGLP